MNERFLAVISAANTAPLLAFFLLTMIEIIGRPRRVLCDCPMFKFRGPWHLDTPGLMVGMVASSAVAVGDLVLGTFVQPLYLLGAAVYGWWARDFHKRWKAHKKDGRKKLGEKLLARVKATAAGLKVVPIPSPHRAHFGRQAAAGGVLAMVLVFSTAGGCGADGPKELPSGTTKLTKNMAGGWKAPGGPYCSWKVQVKRDGSSKWITVSNGKGSSPTLYVFTSNAGGRLVSDGCGVWTRR